MKKLVKTMTVAGLSLAAAVLSLAGCASGERKPFKIDFYAAEYGEPFTQEDCIFIAEGYIGAFLKDPYSAKWRHGKCRKAVGIANAGARVMPNGSRAESDQVVYGYAIEGSVNAKNSFGGYTGAKGYRMLLRNRTIVLVSDTETAQGALPVQYAPADVRSPSEIADECPLCIAAKQGNIAEMKRILASGEHPDTTTDNGTTPLSYASKYGGYEAAKVMLDAGANVNASNKKGGTALMGAADAGRIEVVRMLLDAGANLNAKTSAGWTALGMAKYKEQAEVIRFLEAMGAK